jgi:hypothetical protein
VQRSLTQSKRSELWTNSLNKPDDYLPGKGCTLLIPSGTLLDPDGKHLFVVLTNPCEGGHHLLASISSVKPNRAHDPTCILEAGEHPWLDRKSYVFYARVRQVPHAGLIKCVRSGLYIPKENCDEPVLKKICAGVTESAMTPRWAKEYFRRNSDRDKPTSSRK